MVVPIWPISRWIFSIRELILMLWKRFEHYLGCLWLLISGTALRVAVSLVSTGSIRYTEHNPHCWIPSPATPLTNSCFDCLSTPFCLFTSKESSHLLRNENGTGSSFRLPVLFCSKIMFIWVFRVPEARAKIKQNSLDGYSLLPGSLNYSSDPSLGLLLWSCWCCGSQWSW